MPVRVTGFPQPSEDVWYPHQQDNPHQPAANGLVEHIHRTLKTTIMCHDDEQWTAALPRALLDIRIAYKEDWQSSAAELVYGEALHVPSELLVKVGPKGEASTPIEQLRHHIDQLQTTQAVRHISPTKFIHKDPRDSTHVFLWKDTTRRALEPP